MSMPVQADQQPAELGRTAPERGEELSTDLLILTDGTVLAHNLTPEMADVLKQVHELPD